MNGEEEEESVLTLGGHTRYGKLSPTTPDQSSPLSISSGMRPRMSKISPRRLSISLAESFNQLEIPFKPKRKSSVPVIPTFERKEVDKMKLQFWSKKEVNQQNSVLTIFTVASLISCY